MYWNFDFFFLFHKSFLIYLLPTLAYEFLKYQRGCDTWQVTAKIAQLCIFLTKSHERTVNRAISSWNFSNDYMIMVITVYHLNIHGLIVPFLNMVISSVLSECTWFTQLYLRTALALGWVILKDITMITQSNLMFQITRVLNLYF